MNRPMVCDPLGSLDPELRGKALDCWIRRLGMEREEAEDWADEALEQTKSGISALLFIPSPEAARECFFLSSGPDTRILSGSSLQGEIYVYRDPRGDTEIESPTPIDPGDVAELTHVLSRLRSNNEVEGNQTGPSFLTMAHESGGIARFFTDAGWGEIKSYTWLHADLFKVVSQAMGRAQVKSLVDEYQMSSGLSHFNLDEYADFLNAIWRDESDWITQDADSLSEIDGSEGARYFFTLAEKESGRPAAHCWSRPLDGHRLYVQNIGVSATSRKSGLGSLMMGLFAAQGLRLGYRRAALKVDRDGQEGLLAFYHKLGFSLGPRTQLLKLI